MPETLLRVVLLLLPAALVPFLLAVPRHTRSPYSPPAAPSAYRASAFQTPSTASQLGNLLRATTAGLIALLLALILLEIRRQILPDGFATEAITLQASVVALSEEAAKLAAFFLVFRPRGGQVRPALKHAAAVALVFAVFENMLYFTVPVSLLWTRALVVPAVHAGSTVILVAVLLQFKHSRVPLFYGALGVFAVALHAFHNYLIPMSTVPFTVRLMPSLISVTLAMYLHYRSPSHSI